MALAIRTDPMRFVALLSLIWIGCSSTEQPTPVDAAGGVLDAGAPAVTLDAAAQDAAQIEPADAGSPADASSPQDAQLIADAGMDCMSMAPGYAKQICLKPWIQDLTRRDGAADALCAAEDLLESGQVSDCHLLAHFVGEVVFEQNDRDPARSLVACPATCLSGCGHQVMQELVEVRDLNTVFREQGSDAVDQELRALVGVCRAYEGDNFDRFILCVHGIGHGLLSSGFLSPLEAAQLCDEELGLEGISCAAGVFMEHTSRYLRLEEDQLLETLPTICALGGSDWEDLCWRNVGEALMWFYGHQLEAATAACNRLSGEDPIKACSEGAEVEAGVAEMQQGTCP